MPSHRIALSFLALMGCTPAIEGTSTPSTSDDGEVAPPESLDDTDAPEDTGDDNVEVLPPSRANAVVDPPARLFVDPLTVTIASDEGVGQVMACVGAPDRPCSLSPTDSLTLDEPGVVYARVDFDDAEGVLTATPYVRVTQEVADFTSNLPVLVAWGEEANDDLWTNTPLALLTFDHETDRTQLTGPADLYSRCRFRIRGSSSSSLDKKNFDLELWEDDSDDDRRLPLVGLPEDADWVLHAPSYYDDALIRNALGYQLSRDIGRYSPRTVFTELFLLTNDRTLRLDDYRGVYVVTEELERGPDRVDIAKLGPEDIAEPEVTGGYVFKRDREGGDGEGIYVGDADNHFYFTVPIVPVDPEQYDMEPEQLDYLSDELDALGNALAAADGLDPASGRPWQDILDIDSFIDHHILAVVVKNPDAFRLSGYFHKDREGPVHAGPIWDLDRTAGSIDSRATDPYHWDASNITTDTTALFEYGWYGALFDDPDFRTRYWARWQTLLAGPLAPEAVAAHIATMRTELSEAGPRNNSRWGAPTWSGEMDHIAAWYAARMTWIGSCIDVHDDPQQCAGAF